MRVILAAVALILAAEAAQASPPETNQPIPEVKVTARIAALRAEMLILEDKFYAEYNRLNADHQFDMRCDEEVPTGSRLESRQCRPVFVERAQADYAKNYINDLQSKDGLALTPPPPASTAIMGKWSAFEKNMLTSIRRHPELRKLINERNAAEKRYEELRKED